PCTRTSTRRTPRPAASRPACSPATVAANGVDFLEPLKPALPALAHVTTFPALSVIVMIVLLNVALTWATPSASTTFLLRLGRALGLATRVFLFYVRGVPGNRLLLGRLLLARDGPPLPLVRPGVRPGPLAAYRQAATVAKPAVAADVHEPLDVHGRLGTQRALDLVLALDLAAETVRLLVPEILRAQVRRDRAGLDDLPGPRTADPVDVGQRDLDPLAARE